MVYLISGICLVACLVIIIFCVRILKENKSLELRRKREEEDDDSFRDG